MILLSLLPFGTSSHYLHITFSQCVCPKTWQVLCFSSFSLTTPLITAAFFCLHSVSVQRRDRCSVSYIGPFKTPLFVSPLLSSGYTVYLSKDVTGLCSLPHPTPPFFRTPFPPPPCFVCLSLDLLCYVLREPIGETALFWLHSASVQRRDRCSATYSTLSSPSFLC